MYNQIFLSSWNHLRYVSASSWHHSEVSSPAQDDLCWWGESWGNQAQGLDGGHRKPSGRVSAAPWGSSLLVSCVSEDDEGVLPLEDSLHDPGVNDGAPWSLETLQAICCLATDHEAADKLAPQPEVWSLTPPLPSTPTCRCDRETSSVSPGSWPSVLTAGRL